MLGANRNVSGKLSMKLAIMIPSAVDDDAMTWMMTWVTRMLTSVIMPFCGILFLFSLFYYLPKYPLRGFLNYKGLLTHLYFLLTYAFGKDFFASARFHISHSET